LNMLQLLVLLKAELNSCAAGRTYSPPALILFTEFCHRSVTAAIHTELCIVLLVLLLDCGFLLLLFSSPFLWELTEEESQRKA
jgi:hypothetical protein